MALTKNARTIVAASTSAVPGTPQRGRLDMNAVQGGGFLTIKMTPAGTLGVQCSANILVAHNATLPAAGSAGTDWKTIASYGSGLTSGVTTEFNMPIDSTIMCLEVEFIGNTTNNCTVEAYLSELTTAV